MNESYHKTKKRLTVPPVMFGQIDSGSVIFVRPEERQQLDCRSWEICFMAERPNQYPKAYCWLVFPYEQSEASALVAFKKRMRDDPIDASTVTVFEVCAPPMAEPITPAIMLAMFPEDKEFAAQLKATKRRIEIADAKYKNENSMRMAC